ncbi:MAG: FHA domain-containing protein [Solirubrobacterales bacterium]|nr:FHA domain-containing protein [Solirubrobacterales bacterium]
MRVGDGERRRAAARLRASYVRGELSDETFESRVAAVLTARHADELAAAAGDLPTLLDRVALALRALVPGRPRVPEGPALVVPADAPSGTTLLLGRALDCDVRFAERSVSRAHAELRRTGGGWLVVDRCSTNGTWVNGRRVERARVADGDELQLGGARVVLRG